jgi:hypothetical protein
MSIRDRGGRSRAAAGAVGDDVGFGEKAGAGLPHSKGLVYVILRCRVPFYCSARRGQRVVLWCGLGMGCA